MKRTVYSRLMYAAIPAVLLLSLHAADTPPRPGCENRLYLASDGRLQPHIVGLLPRGNQRVVGFEVIRDLPLVAFPHSLVGFEKKRVSELPVNETIKGLSYENDARVLVQSDSGFFRLGSQGLEPVGRLNALVHGRIYGSGNPVFVEVRARQGFLEFIARKIDGTAFSIAAIKGPLRAASWNESGLTAVVGDSLYLWQPGTKNIVRLLTDRGLAAARDAVAVGDNRAVVALKATVVLITPETITIVGALPLGRCRFQNGVLYVLQESTGLIWSFRGLEKLGTKQADKAFARDLLKQAENSPAKEGAQFQEAARILGCKEAEVKNTVRVVVGETASK